MVYNINWVNCKKKLTFWHKVASMLIHHALLQSKQKHRGALLNCENWFDLIWSLDKQVLSALLTLTVNDFLALLPFVSFNRLFILDCIHRCLTKPMLILKLLALDPVILWWVSVRIMFGNVLLLLYPHDLVLFLGLLGNLLILLVVIIRPNEIIDWLLRSGLWELFQLS